MWSWKLVRDISGGGVGNGAGDVKGICIEQSLPVQPGSQKHLF